MRISTSKKTTSWLGNIVVIHSLVTIVASFAASRLFVSGELANFLIGQAYAWLSLLSLSFSVYLFFLKKNIALLVAVIVFKWPILIYVVYRVTQTVKLEPVFMALGFFPLVLSFLLWAFMQKE